jgi:hypothetical protein
MRALVRLTFFISFVVAAPLAAQDDGGVTPPDGDGAAETNAAETPAPPAPEPAPRRMILDLSVTVPRDESDRLLEKDCEDANEAGRVANEIVVCRELGEATDGSWNKEDFEKRYAERTAFKNAPRTPDFIADCKDQGMPFGCVALGGAPPPAYIVDFDALPDTPEGSDADRIARGLPPLGQDRELTEEEEKARRAALGLPTPEPKVGAPR